MNRAFAFTALLALSAASKAHAQRPIPVNVESIPAGASVYLDGEAQLLGVTPLRNVRIARGTHTLIFKLANHEDGRLQVNIAQRRETFRIQLSAVSRISVSATNEAANGAAVRIDGQPVGNIPFQTNVQPGRHLVQVGREGYVTFSQWVDLAGGQVLTLPVQLEAEAPRTGSLLVAGDVSGAAIYVDGTPRGSTPTVIEGLTEGPHQVEVRGSDAGMQPFTQSVHIIAGQRAVLNPTLRPAAPQGGSLRVIVNVPGAIVSVDGEVIGEAPATRQNLSPGEHIVEARAEGYEPAQQPVTIEPGAQRIAAIQLQAVARAPGRIVVNANVDGAVVLIDGEERGSPPVVVDQAAGGTHAIIVRATGYQEYRETCSVGPSQNCEIHADLRPVGTPVRVEANVNDAEFLVDGEIMGPVPWEGTVPVGSHLIEVRAPGRRAYRAQVALQPQSETRLFNVGLVGEDEMTPEERQAANEARRERHEQAVSRSGATLPDDLAVLDMSIGWPFLAEFRLGIGILPWLEAGIGLRTMFTRLTEFEGRVKVGIRPAKQVSFGAQLRIGGGLGPTRDATMEEQMMAEMMDEEPPTHPMSDFFFSLEGLFSLHFLRAGNFTMWAALDYTSDQYAWSSTNHDCRYEAGACNADGSPDPDFEPEDGNPLLDERQRMARLRVGGSLEFILSSAWNLWISFEGATGPNRRVFGDVFGGGNADIHYYTRAGFTYKFGYAERDEDYRPPPSDPVPTPEPVAEPVPAPAP